MNPENKCAHLFNQKVEKLPNISEMFEMQKSLQHKLSLEGKALDHEHATFTERIQDMSVQWKNMTLEFAELLERLPHKDWKTYSAFEKSGFTSEEHRLEVLYEYIDIFHFFMNIGLNLGVDGELFAKLYATKNKENFDRQERGY